MTKLAALEFYATHSPLTDPGAHSALLDGLTPDIPLLCGTLQGLLIHEAWLAKYGASPAAFAGQSRATLPVAQRLEQLISIDPAPLSHPRPAESRALATCRDFALLLCGVLRHHAVPSRVRCGFGRYFTANQYEDHWVCEYWAAGEQRWILVDAQLDRPQRDALKFEFDPTDLPVAAFTTGVDAWTLCRNGVIRPGNLGHGATTGLFFARVNLARDLFALAKVEASEWDTWRSAPEIDRRLNERDLSLCDRLAAERDENNFAPAPSLPRPPWQ
jgi:hypothetical protein